MAKFDKKQQEMFFANPLKPVKLTYPHTVFVNNNQIYVIDTYCHQVKKLSNSLKFSVVLSGTSFKKSLRFPIGGTFDKLGNIYVSDTENNTIIKLSKSGGVSTIDYKYDFQKNKVSFNYPSCLVSDENSNIYVVDTFNNKIVKINTDGIARDFAGSGEKGYLDGPLEESKFDRPFGISINKTGDIFVSDKKNHVIRKIDVNSGTVSTAAGSGIPGWIDGNSVIKTCFNYPSGIVFDKDDNLIIADTDNNKIRRLTNDGLVFTVAGSAVAGYEDGNVDTCQFSYPMGVAVDDQNNILVADTYNHIIRSISLSGAVSTII